MLLTGEPDIEVVTEARNGLGAVAMTQRFDPSVVLMDIQMPELDGLEATRPSSSSPPSEPSPRETRSCPPRSPNR
jgi:YesN/AraC family two-component response regulator